MTLRVAYLFALYKHRRIWQGVLKMCSLLVSHKAVYHSLGHLSPDFNGMTGKSGIN